MTVTLNFPVDTAYDAVLESLQHRIRIDIAGLTAVVDATTIQSTSLPELHSKLAAAIYTHLHIQHPDIGKVRATRHQDLADALIAEIPHRSIVQSASATTVPETTIQGVAHSVVDLAGVKVLFPAPDVVRSPAGEVVGVRVPSWRNRTTPGFLLALGSRGFVDPRRAARLYIACDAAPEALEIWPYVLRALAASGLSHHVKALSSTLAYPRSDAMVIYVSASDAVSATASVAPVLRSLSRPKSSPSVFTRLVTDRLALAEEPNDPRPSYHGLSFGQHRSRVLADALLRSSLEGKSLRAAWAVEARAAHINPHEPGYGLDH